MFPSISIRKLLYNCRLLLNISPGECDVCPIIRLRVKWRVNINKVNLTTKRWEACLGITSKEGLHCQEVVTIDEAVHPLRCGGFAIRRHVEGIWNLRRTALEQSTHILTWQHQFIGLKPNLRTTTQPL